MNKTSLYRLALRLLPRRRLRLQPLQLGMPEHQREAYQRILRRHKALGGALACFDAEGLTDHFVYGDARPGIPVAADTAFRLASVSKLVTGAGTLMMQQAGALDLDRDADLGLPYSLRHPGAPGTPITLRMLLSHTAGIQDGADYLAGIQEGRSAPALLRGDSHTAHLPGAGCEYSNFGVGLAGCVIEAQTGLSFEMAMQRHLFEPLGLAASYYPQRLSAMVADARRILPPRKAANFSGAARQAQPDIGWDSPDPAHHHLYAHGSCCMDVASLVKLGQALLRPGFFTEDSLLLMRSPRGSLMRRDPALTQGLGMFILRDAAICDRPLYGHQGMAYGAVHMLFLDLESGRGIISLTTGASEARSHIMADINRALLTEWVQHG